MVLAGALAATATFLAVVVAVRSSRASIKTFRELRNEDRDHQREVERMRAVARSLVFDHEMYMLGGEISMLSEALEPDLVAQEPQEALRWLENSFPRHQLPMLTRFAGDLDAFGAEDMAKLLAVLSGWNSISEPMKYADFEGAPDQVLIDGIASHRRGFGVFLTQLKEAREVTRRWAVGVRTDLPETDWG